MKKNLTRKHRDKKTETPELVYLDDILHTGDCFGKLYSLRSNECKMCADSGVCAFVYNEVVKKLENKVAKKKVYNFDAVLATDLFDKLADNRGKYEYSKVVNAVKKISDCQEDEIVEDFIKTHFSLYGLEIKDGYVW